MTTKQVMKLLLFNVEKQAAINTNPYLQQSTTIIDFDGAGLSNMSIDMIKEVRGLLETCYIDLLGRQMLTRTVWAVPQVWRVVKLFLKQDVIDKTFFYSESEYKQELLKHIDKKQLPKNFGGSAPKV